MNIKPKMKKNLKHLLTLTILAMMLVGVVLPTAAQEGESITVAFTQEPDSLNDMYTTMTFAGYVYQLLSSAAWDFDQDLNPVPTLVTELPTVENGGLNEEGTQITLTLRDDIVWSDGEPITADDFVFTYEMYTSEPNTPLTRAPYDQVASIEAADERTVVVNFDAPYAPWLGLFKQVLPEHVLRPVFEAEGNIDNAEWNRSISVGSGPYILDEWQVGSFMRLSANPNYFNGVPEIETVIVSFIPDDQAYVAALAAGEADLGTFIAFSDIPSLEQTGLVTIQLLPSGYNEHWTINTGETGHPALDDVNVRRAIIMGFNREAITNDLLLGETYVPSSFWEQTPYENTDIEPLPYDPETANQLLDEAGWVDSNGNGTRDKDGTELVLRLVTNTRQIRQDVQVVAQQQLAEIGVGIEIINHPSDVFFNGYAQGGPVAIGDYDLAQWSSAPAVFPDPDTARFRCDQIPSDENPTGDNWSGFCDPELDALFEQQASTIDFDARAAVFHEIDARIAENVTWAGVWYDADVWVRNNRIENINLNAVRPFWQIQEWTVAG